MVVSELLDVIDESFTVEATDRPRRARDHVMVRHPLQPFSAAYFERDGDPRLFSYSPRYFEGARARLEPRQPAPAFFPKRLPPPEEKARTVTLEELCSFFTNPIKSLVLNRLGVRLGEDEEAILDREPMELDALDRYKLGADLLRRALSGEGLADAYTYLRAKGVLPSARWGESASTGCSPGRRARRRRPRAHRRGAARAPRDRSPCGETRVTGWLRDLFPRARVEHRFASIKPTDELKIWIRHLALQYAARPGDPRVSVYIGLKDDDASVVRFNEIGAATAGARLTDLVNLYHLGQTLPLCFFPRTSYAYAKSKAKPEDDAAAERAARAAFFGASFKNAPEPESADRYVERVLAGRDPIEPGFRVLDPASPGASEEPAFAELALTVFGPLLAHREGA